MLLIVEKGIRIGLCQAIHLYVSTNNKYMEEFDKNKESSHLKCFDEKYLNVWLRSKKLSVNHFKWAKETSRFNKDSW